MNSQPAGSPAPQARRSRSRAAGHSGNPLAVGRASTRPPCRGRRTSASVKGATHRGRARIPGGTPTTSRPSRRHGLQRARHRRTAAARASADVRRTTRATTITSSGPYPGPSEAILHRPMRGRQLPEMRSGRHRGAILVRHSAGRAPPPRRPIGSTRMAGAARSRARGIGVGDGLRARAREHCGEHLPREQRLRRQAEEDVGLLAHEVVPPGADLLVLQPHVDREDVEEEEEADDDRVHERGRPGPSSPGLQT